MKAKVLKFIISVFCIVVLVVGCKSKSMIEVNSEFEFKPVVAGIQVNHDFKIKNIGNKPLNIIRVRPG